MFHKKAIATIVGLDEMAGSKNFLKNMVNKHYLS
jgi:hypothetical protein